MATSIYVGNLSFSSTQAGLENLFSQYGTEFEGRTLRVNEAEKRPAPRRW